jgi:peroxiredoxin
MASIAERVAELKKGIPGRLPDHVVSAFAAEQAHLAESGVPAGAARPGVTLDDAKLLDAHGEPTTLSAVANGARTVLVFYRGAWCPYCNIALRTYQEDLLPGLRDRDVTLVAVSPQAPDGSLSMREKNDLAFPVVSDPGNVLAGALGIVTAPTDDTRAAQVLIGTDLTTINADGTTAVPMPTVAVVDADRTLRWIDVHPDYTTRTEAAEVLAALDALA